MNDQGTVTLKGEEKLAKFIAVLIENSSARFEVEQGDDDWYIIKFDGGY